MFFPPPRVREAEMRRNVARSLAVLFTVLVLASTPVAAAESRLGGTVVVSAGETVDGDLEVIGGTVIVRGTVDGDLEAVGGTVVVAETGVITGDLSGTAGAVTVEGRIEGTTQLATGSFTLRESGVLVGDAKIAAGEALFDGRTEGTVRVDAETVRVGSSAVVAGDFLYDAEEYTAEGGEFQGDVRAVDLDFGTVDGRALFTLPSGASVVYSVLVHLALGGVLLLAVPRFVTEVGDTGMTRTARSGGVGLAAVLLGPLLLALLAVTIVGIPLALLGAVAYGVLLWVGLVLGAYVLGWWGLRALDRGDAAYARWYALVSGVLVVGLSQFVPGGGFLRLALMLLGVGAVVIALNARRIGGRDAGAVGPDAEAGGDATS